MAMSWNDLTTRLRSGDITPETRVGPGSTTAADLFARKLYYDIGFEPVEAIEKYGLTEPRLSTPFSRRSTTSSTFSRTILASPPGTER
jgi:hypothetical protein